MVPNKLLKVTSIMCIAILFSALFTVSFIQPSKADILIDGIIDEGEYEQKLSLQNGDYEYYWRYEENKVVMGIKAKTTGWVSFGISPAGKNKMDHADIIIGWVDANGETKIYDAFSEGETGPHPQDESLGGVNDITVYTGMEIDGYTILEFQRLVETKDNFDLPFPTSGFLKYIAAYGTKDEYASMHAFRVSGDIEIAKKAHSKIDAKLAKELYDNTPSLYILDVSNAWKIGHLPGAVNVEMNEIEQKIVQFNKERAILIYGRNEESAIFVADLFMRNDYEKVYRLVGGFEAWVKAGYPIETYKEKTTIRFQVGNETYWVDESMHTMDTKPVIIEGRTMLPIRFLAESIGARLNWGATTQEVFIYLQYTEITMKVGNPQAVVSGKVVYIDPGNTQVKPIIMPPGRTFLPLRFVAENLQCKVDWNSAKQEIAVTYQN
jgi:rhodanese-related sulfurtransferase